MSLEKEKVLIIISLLGAIIFDCSVLAMPEPLVQIDFNGDWQSVGLAGTDVGVVTDSGDPDHVAPIFGNGILSLCFDQMSAEFDSSGGAVVYGSQSSTVMQAALSGLKSFTITGFLYMDPNVYGDPNHVGTIPLSIVGLDGNNAIAILLDRYNRLSLMVNGLIETDPYGGTGIHWYSPFTDGRWAFFAVTYDGTVDLGSDPFTTQNVVWYTGATNGAIVHRVVQSTQYDGVLYAGDVNTVSQVWIGNTPDTALRYVDVNGDIDLAVDPNYPATFAGKTEEIYIFGSKTDSSGVLSSKDIEAIRDNAIWSICGGPSNPYPTGDLTKDCLVNIFDFARLASSWMEDTQP